MKLLFITHETTRTGAPMVLLLFLEWLQANHSDIDVDVLALKTGNLEVDFKKVCHRFYDYKRLLKSKKRTLLQRVFLKLGLLKKTKFKDVLVKELTNNNYALIYANTMASIPIANDLVSKNKTSKLIVHLHELNAIIKLGLPNLKDYKDSINQFIAPSNLVKTNLIDNWDISKNTIDVVYECTNIDNKADKLLNKKSKIFTVGASGTVHWRKGHDIFIQLARYIYANYPDINIKFIWVGKVPLREQIIIKEDIKKLGLEEKVVFTGEVETPSDYFKDFDVFVMTSREDPFPLVCIEVGMLEKPIISFDKAVGTNEILVKAGGFIVPYLDIETMAARVLEYYENPLLLKKHGALNEKAFSKFTPELICPKLFKIIKTHI